MNSRHIFNSCLVTAMVAIGTSCRLDVATAQQDQVEGVQVLTRGPVHEAFAESVTYDPQPGIVVPNAPPEAIEELPPEQRPEGDNVNWIPGYFAWDDEREDYLWISGIWRNLPPGRQWMPGYWAESANGVQWIAGYWADATLTEVRYLPEPPASVEVGPNIDAPSVDHVWLPGCWVWHEERYAWRPGYWDQMQPDWDWIPAHYAWSPRGYLFVDGYYDYSLARRGVLFAPVYFDSHVHSRRGYSYSPSTVINLAHFTSHLFSRPRYNHYYIGDYYASDYATSGYYPWYSYGASGYGYDPFFNRQRWDHRQDRDWERRIEAEFGNRRDNEDARPARTLADQVARLANATDSTDGSLMVAMSLEELSTSQDSPVQFQKLDENERLAVTKRGQDIRAFRQERQKLEAEAAESATPDPSGRPEPVIVQSSPSPIVSKSDQNDAKVLAPPEAPDAPELDLKVDPTSEANSDAKEERREQRANRSEEARSERSKGKATTDDSEAQPRAKGKDRPKSNTPGDQPKDRPKSDREKPDSKDTPPDEPGVSPPKGSPKDQPKVNPPKQNPKDLPKVDPPKDKPKDQPKVNPPKQDPKDQPKVDPPKGKPKDQPKINPPKRDRKDQPKVNPPKVDPPKGTRKDQPKVNPPKQDPKDPPKVDPPKVDPPKVDPPKDKPRKDKPNGKP